MREPRRVVEVAVRQADRAVGERVVGRAPEFEQRPEPRQLEEGLVARDRDSLDRDAGRLEAHPAAALRIVGHARKLSVVRFQSSVLRVITGN